MYELPDKQDQIDYLGLNFSYKYNVKSNWGKINLFLEFKYSIYNLKYESYSGHYAGLEEK
ncbi:MAG: hypothetical protein IMY72_14060 [Bacteroidetes bacterium]|nr:hypothetical protein [Bacteroidota bacterium]